MEAQLVSKTPGTAAVVARAAAAAAIGKTPVVTDVSIAAQKAAARQRWDKHRPKNQRANVQWRRLKDNFDDLVQKAGSNPELGSVITRWVLYKHLSKSEGLAGRLVGEIIGRYEKYWNADGLTRTSGSPSFQRGTAGRADEIARHIVNGTLKEYERRAKQARKRYSRLCRVIIGGFGDDAWDTIVEVCVSDREVDPRLRADVAVVLRAVGKEFGLIDTGGRPKKRVWRA